GILSMPSPDKGGGVILRLATSQHQTIAKEIANRRTLCSPGSAQDQVKFQHGLHS
ncbi:hypothetical protein BgiMline_003789, partial [Biomphalaria glabrata]